MKSVKSFQTSDNQLFFQRSAALNHEQKLELRGLIQSHTKNAQLSSTDIATILAVNADKVSEILHRYRIQINRAKGSENKVAVIH
jgi:predicted XRE-type DNA-binding protein